MTDGPALYIRRMRWLALVFAFFAPLQLWAHPHIFIDAAVEARVDAEGRLTEVKITWVYDDFYSLLITEDMRLDRDYDGALTEDEKDQLTGFDMKWHEDFNGDLVILNGDQELALSRPFDYTASLEDGRITTTHVRTVEGAPSVIGEDLVILPYDGTFYTAYDVSGLNLVSAFDGCRMSMKKPDIDAALREMEAELALLDINEDPEDIGLADPGRAFATEVSLSCAGS